MIYTESNVISLDKELKGTIVIGNSAIRYIFKVS